MFGCKRVNYDEMDGDRLRLPANRNCYRLSRVSWALLKFLVKLKRQSRRLTYVNSYSETYSAGCTSVKGKIWVIYRKFSGKLPVNYLRSVSVPILLLLLILLYRKWKYARILIMSLSRDIQVIFVCYCIRICLSCLFIMCHMFDLSDASLLQCTLISYVSQVFCRLLLRPYPLSRITEKLFVASKLNLCSWYNTMSYQTFAMLHIYLSRKCKTCLISYRS